MQMHNRILQEEEKKEEDEEERKREMKTSIMVKVKSSLIDLFSVRVGREEELMYKREIMKQTS